MNRGMDTTYDALKKEVPPYPETHTNEVLITLCVH